MRLHLANHDFQIVIDPYGALQYMMNYLTKSEAGTSRMLKAVNEETNSLHIMEKLNSLAAVLDKNREASVQEAIYRILGLPMAKCSVIVKFISTVHPDFRDGLLKKNIEEISEDENVFHNSPQDYYENRPDSSDQHNVNYDEEEIVTDYWKNITLAEFWCKYDVVYQKQPQLTGSIIKLKDGSFIRRRIENAVLRYYLNYGNDEDLARGLLVLFKPFRKEIEEIHSQDVQLLLNENREFIEMKRQKFEKYKLMTELISNIQSNVERTSDDNSDEEGKDLESTSREDIEDFGSWAKAQAKKELSNFKDMINIGSMETLRSNISSLNYQQRRIFDDWICRTISSDLDENPAYLFIAGEAGTGKSHLVRVIIEAVKVINLQAGADIQKPSVLTMAPTANASFLIGGKTNDSALGFSPMDSNCYRSADEGRMATMKFMYEDLKLIVVDEISMVGAMKLAKINYRLQELADGHSKQQFMGGISFIASGLFYIFIVLSYNQSCSGDLRQLPPIHDSLITDKNKIDGRPEIAPSHWKQNFKIYYMTEKMRSQQDPHFCNLCDRVGMNTITEEDENYLRSRIQETPSESNNENFKLGKLSIIVITNKKRNLVNEKKLAELLPDERMFSCNSIDDVMNVPEKVRLSKKINENPGRTGNLLNELKVKVNAPVVITTNHSKRKYREDGIMNGARGYVQKIQVSKDNPERVDVIWVVFNNENIGKRYRFDHRHLRKGFDPGHEKATPILPQRRNFNIKMGNVQYQRCNFPLALAYAVTAHKCQGETSDEVIIDFGDDKEFGIKTFICPGSFYVALTRVKMGCKVFLRSFDRRYIKTNKDVQEKIDAMRKFNSYNFKNIYLDEKIFETEEDEVKLGYWNINGLMNAGHAQYLNNDYNLLSLDLLVLSETKLEKNISVDEISKILSSWKIIARFDSEDQRKHMGMLVLSSRHSNVMNQINRISYDTLKRNEIVQVETLTIQLRHGEKYGFTY